MALTAQEETVKNALAKKLAAFVHPVWIDGVNHIPLQVGSCSLLKTKGTVTLLTAAHVLNENVNETLFLVTPAGPVMIEGVKHTSKSRTRDPQHRDDPLDLAIIPLQQDSAVAVESLEALCLEQCDDKAVPLPGSLYFACGYPWTKNRKVDVRRGKLSKRLFTYFTKSHPPAVYESLRLTRGIHFVVDYNKRHVIAAGLDVTGPDLAGVSGGLLWRSDGVSNQVVGVITGWPTRRNLTKSIIATHIRLFLKAIYKIRPDLRTS